MYTPPAEDFQEGQPFEEGVAVTGEMGDVSASIYRRAIYIVISVLIILALLFSMIGPVVFRYIQPPDEREGELQAGRTMTPLVARSEKKVKNGGTGFL